MITIKNMEKYFTHKGKEYDLYNHSLIDGKVYSHNLGAVPNKIETDTDTVYFTFSLGDIQRGVKMLK
jgi:hypothetical protein